MWHYQTTPGDAWDYNSAMDMVLASLTIDGKPRKVILHAPKNGFFYVIDRMTGKLISAEKLGKVTWAERVDLATGRPVEAQGARYDTSEVLLWPSFQGVHNWWPMSFSPKTGLVYVPTIELASVFSDIGVNPASWKPILYGTGYTGMRQGDGDLPASAGASTLTAWDPVKQRAAWKVSTPGAFNGGTLATAGNLVFQGLADGYVHAYSTADGQRLWSFFAGTAVIGTPITYSVDGRQYLSILAGPLNGSAGGFGSLSAQFGWDARIHPRRLLTFVLDGTAKLPPTAPPTRATPLDAPEFVIDPAAVELGTTQYVSRCVLCHGPAAVAGGTAPDLRASTVPLSLEAFAQIVRGGALEARGMPRFAELTDAELDAIRHYLRARAREALHLPAK